MGILAFLFTSAFSKVGEIIMGAYYNVWYTGFPDTSGTYCLGIILFVGYSGEINQYSLY